MGKRRSRPREQLIQKFIGMHRHGVFEEQIDDFFLDKFKILKSKRKI